MSRMDKDVFLLVTVQTTIHESLSRYFYARWLWQDQQKYGLAIAVLSEAAISTRAHSASAGIPDLSAKSHPLHPLHKDVQAWKAHLALLLSCWEKDNSNVFFERVPAKVPEEMKLLVGLQMDKAVPYSMDDVDPLPLSIPETGGAPNASLTRSDSDLARQLHEELNRS